MRRHIQNEQRGRTSRLFASVTWARAIDRPDEGTVLLTFRTMAAHAHSDMLAPHLNLLYNLAAGLGRGRIGFVVRQA